jgi:putative transferase (TIGR04331 family)
LKNNLILSSNKENVSKDFCNIFLEERILFDFDKEDLKKLNYFVADSVLYENQDRVNSFVLCENIFNSIIGDIYLNLNNIHNISWSKRSWEILIGFWVKKFIYIIFYKFKLLENTIFKNDINKIFLSYSKTGFLASHESDTIQELSINTDWSWILTSKIFEYLDVKNIIVEKSENPKNDFYENNTFYKRINANSSFVKKKFINFISFLNKLLSENNNLIVTTYLPRLKEKQLEMMFCQSPRFYYPNEIEYNPINIDLRKKLNLNKVEKEISVVEKIVRELIPSYLPTLAIENFKQLKIAAYKNNYPSNPKFIFTSNSFEADEAFKFYLANIISSNKNPKYFVGQHGNSYFTRIDNNYNNELLTCDYFLAWGKYNTGSSKIINLFNLKLPIEKKIKETKEKLTIVFRSLGYQTVPYDRWQEGKKEFFLAKQFLLYCPDNFKKKIHLRLHDSFKKRYKFFVEDFLNGLNNIDRDFGEKNYETIIENSKIVVFTYDSTGFLENILLNKPSVCLYPDTFNHLNQDCHEIYKNLKDQNIIFDDPKKLYEHIMSIWSNVDSWWSSDKVKSTINSFKFLFSQSGGKKPLSLLKASLVNKL